MATIRDWDALEKFSKEKRPPIGKVSNSWFKVNKSVTEKKREKKGKQGGEEHTFKYAMGYCKWQSGFAATIHWDSAQCGLNSLKLLLFKKKKTFKKNNDYVIDL